MIKSSLDKFEFGEELLKRLSVLKDNQYKFLGVCDRYTQALGAYLEATFSNDSVNRLVRASYLPAVKNHPDVLKIFIENGGIKSFAIDECLKYIGRPSELINGININAHEGSVGERLSACLDNANKLMEGDLNSVVCGVEWIDVPINWEGYR